MTPETNAVEKQEQPPRRRLWLTVVVLTLVVVAGITWWRWPGPSEPETADAAAEKSGEPAVLEIEPDVQRAVGLKDAPAEKRTLAETIQTTGVVGPDETRLARIRPLAEGRVTRVAVRVGDRVKAGQALLMYDSITAGDLISQYRSALASLEQATAEAEVTKRSLERADNLLDLGGVSKSERERRSAEHQRALAEVNIARSTVTSLEQKLRRLGVSQRDLDDLRTGTSSVSSSTGAVIAPFDGVVTEVRSAQGETITPERELFTIADLGHVWLQADVYQRDISRIRIGQNAIVTVDAYPGEEFSGRITNISDVLDPDTRTAKVRCELLNPKGRLKLQMFATLALPVSTARSVLVIPERAVQDIDGVPTVFVRIDEEHFQTRPVRLGARVGGVVEIADGLTDGERVVTDGALMLKSKLKLRVEEEEGEKPAAKPAKKGGKE